MLKLKWIKSLKKRLIGIEEEFGKIAYGSSYVKTKSLRYFRIIAGIFYILPIILLIDLWTSGFLSTLAYQLKWVMIFILLVNEFLITLLFSKFNNPHKLIEKLNLGSQSISNAFKIVFRHFGKIWFFASSLAGLNFLIIILLLESLAFKSTNIFSWISAIMPSFPLGDVSLGYIFGLSLILKAFLSLIFILIPFLTSLYVYNQELKIRKTFLNQTKDRSTLNHKIQFIIINLVGSLTELFCSIPLVINKTISGQRGESGCVLGVVRFDLTRRHRNCNIQSLGTIPNPDFVRYVLRAPYIQIHVDLNSWTEFISFGDYTLIFNKYNPEKVKFFEEFLERYALLRGSKWFKK